jgi:hypothetical protein
LTLSRKRRLIRGTRASLFKKKVRDRGLAYFVEIEYICEK